MDDDSLHTLLARGRLSGAQRDRILDQVLEEHAKPARPWRRWAVVAGVALPIAAAAALALVLRGETDGDGAWLVPKGEASGAVLEARCQDRPPGTCRTGDRLVLSADGVKRDGFFAGYAVCGAGERIWYFPTANGALPRVPASTTHVVDQTVRIGEEHGTGRCTLHLFLLDTNADRASLLAGSAALAGKATISLEVLP